MEGWTDGTDPSARQLVHVSSRFEAGHVSSRFEAEPRGGAGGVSQQARGLEPTRSGTDSEWNRLGAVILGRSVGGASGKFCWEVCVCVGG